MNLPTASLASGVSASLDRGLVIWAGDGEGPGTTVITHGFQLTGLRPDWPVWMAVAIRDRAPSGGQVLLYPETLEPGDEPSLIPCDSAQHIACSGSNNPAGETIVVFDWANDSNYQGTGWSEAAGEALAATLIAASSGADPQIPSLSPLHFIGHSRGAVVNSEAAERLVASDFAIPAQMTTLDPHDSGAVAEAANLEEDAGVGGGWEDFDVNDEHPDYRCGPLSDPSEASGFCAWEGIPFHDDYYQTDPLDCFGPPFSPSGRDINGASMLDLTSRTDLCHSDVHSWYYFTVDTQAALHPGTLDPPGFDWFSNSSTVCASAERVLPLRRTHDGFNFSRISGDLSNRCDFAGARQPIAFRFDGREGTVNGDFQKTGTGNGLGLGIPGWTDHGGGGTAAAQSLENYLTLGTNEFRWHNWQWLPTNATAVLFDYEVGAAAGGQSVLHVRLRTPGGVATLHTTSLLVTTDWVEATVKIPESARGKVGSLGFQVLGPAAGVEVHVDNVRLQVPIFTDGFESGTTTAWSP